MEDGNVQSAFRSLRVWQSAIELAAAVYDFTQDLPQEEQYGLVSQMRRCAVSIPSNIAEGARRESKKDFRRFLGIAAGSAAELETQLILAEQIYHRKDIKPIYDTLSSVQKMLSTLIKKLK
ncbi:MAG: four helix bundle protein [Patescibacteria group bacterium UBA2163]